MNRSLLLPVLALAAGAVSPAEGTVRLVPTQYASIQAAINGSQNGDTVLVEPGTYPENINFRGKKILLASRYLTTGDPDYIATTVIDGGTPSHPDTASCVLMVSGEDSTTILDGFTLTHGRGTRWLDEHGAGLFREGGGLLITRSSPVIRHNLFIDNEAINSSGVNSAGGGAIRVGDGSPDILNNVIVLNRAMYGAGIVLNYCSGALIRNNLILRNSAYQAVPGVPTYGGGAIWILLRIPGKTTPNVIHNNTLLANSAEGDPLTASAGRGGAIEIQNADVIGYTNIVWANRQTAGSQVSGPITLTYSCVQDGFAGTGNIIAHPGFSDSGCILSPSSPCVDTGDPSPALNDPPDPSSPGNALSPSLGTIRGDMGAYGGPGAGLLAPYAEPGIYVSSASYDFGLHLPGTSSPVTVPVENTGAAPMVIASVAILQNADNAIAVTTPLPLEVPTARTDSLRLIWSPVREMVFADTALLYHNDPRTQNPLRIALSGNSIPTPRISLDLAEINFGSIDVNVPRKDTTFLVSNVGTATDSVYASINPGTVNPSTALLVSPAAFALPAGESQPVTFTFFPPQIIKTGLGIYAPQVVFASRFGSDPDTLTKQIRFRLTGTLDITAQPTRPTEHSLHQNYPNPFNPHTVVRYELPVGCHVRLAVRDLLGREVAVLVDERKSAGRYEATFNADGLPSGVYIYTLTAGTFLQTRKMILVR